MAKKYDPSQYEMVKDRLKRYKENNPDYRVLTEIISPLTALDDVVVKATIYKNKEDLMDNAPHATGIAEELRDAGFINKTSHVENAETSAIGRALANIDYHGTDKRPSAEEMDKVQRTKEAKSKKKEVKQEKEPASSVDDGDEVVETINGMDSVNDVVAYFNEQISAREGQDKDDFQKKYGPVANSRVQELKEEE